MLTLERQPSFTDSKNLQKCINVSQTWKQERKEKDVLRYNFHFPSNEVDRSMVANFQKNTFSPNGRTGSFLRTPLLQGWEGKYKPKCRLQKITIIFFLMKNSLHTPCSQHLPLKKYLLSIST